MGVLHAKIADVRGVHAGNQQERIFAAASAEGAAGVVGGEFARGAAFAHKGKPGQGERVAQQNKLTQEALSRATAAASILPKSASRAVLSAKHPGRITGPRPATFGGKQTGPECGAGAGPDY